VAVVVVLDVPANETRVVGVQAPLHNVAAMVDSIVVVSMAVHATTTTVAHLLSIPCAKSASSSATPLIGAGIGMMRITCLTLDMLQQQL
jgi:hypothetical protein